MLTCCTCIYIQVLACTSVTLLQLEVHYFAFGDPWPQLCMEMMHLNPLLRVRVCSAECICTVFPP